MKNKKKVLIILDVIICIAVIAVIIIKSYNTNMPNVSESESVSKKAPVEDVVIQNDSDINTVEDITKKDISAIEGNYWYLYNDSEKYCYIFSFSDNDRVDISYLDLSADSDSEFESGYSVYYQENDDIILKYLPDCFPTKDFILTVKDNNIFLDDTQLDREQTLSKDIVKEHFNR